MEHCRIPLWAGREDVALNAFLTPPARGFHDAAAPRPAVIISPGGAYLHLSEAEGTPVALAMAARGYQAFVLEYSVATTVADDAQCRYPAQLLDLAKAVLTVRENAEKWHIDPEKIVTMGFSAGGHTTSHFITQWHEPWLSEAVGAATEQLRPNAAVLCYALTDYVLQQAHADKMKDRLSRVSNQCFLGTGKPTMELLQQQSPCLHVTAHVPPTFLVHAADDVMVPAAHTFHMAQALANAGVSYEMHIFQEGNHGFGTGLDPARPWEQHHARACSAWLDLASTWLLKHFAPETREDCTLSPEAFMA